MRWHQEQARQCELDWDWWGAQLHLKWLLGQQPQQPPDPDLQERLDYAKQALEQAEEKAASQLERVKVIPPRPPHPTIQMLDLGTNYSRSVKADFWTGEAGPNHLGELPCGVQTLAGVPFDIRGLIRLGGAGEGSPGELFRTNVPVGQMCQRVHFRHAADRHAAYWGEIGRYLVHFTDGTKVEIPICLLCFP